MSGIAREPHNEKTVSESSRTEWGTPEWNQKVRALNGKQGHWVFKVRTIVSLEVIYEIVYSRHLCYVLFFYWEEKMRNRTMLSRRKNNSHECLFLSLLFLKTFLCECNWIKKNFWVHYDEMEWRSWVCPLRFLPSEVFVPLRPVPAYPALPALPVLRSLREHWGRILSWRDRKLSPTRLRASWRLRRAFTHFVRLSLMADKGELDARLWTLGGNDWSSHVLCPPSLPRRTGNCNAECIGVRSASRSPIRAPACHRRSRTSEAACTLTCRVRRWLGVARNAFPGQI